MGEVVKEEVPILEVARGDIRPFCRYFLYLPRSNSRSCLIILTVTRSVVLCCVVLYLGMWGRYVHTEKVEKK
jgi:hypothetical protein